MIINILLAFLSMVYLGIGFRMAKASAIYSIHHAEEGVGKVSLYLSVALATVIVPLVLVLNKDCFFEKSFDMLMCVEEAMEEEEVSNETKH